MPDFFKSNPMALRHCLLYEYLRQIPIEQSFIALRMTVGPGVIKKEELQVWFDKFNQGIFDMEYDNEPITDMREVLRSDKNALRACILYESIKFKQAERVNSTMWSRSSSSVHRCNTAFSIYNNFCKVIGEDVMGFPEFDFWFYRFLNEKMDLNYGREEDKKIHELADMPIDVMEKVVEYLDIFERINLAKTSRSLQTFVEDQKLFHHTLDLIISTTISRVSFGESDDSRFRTYENCDRGVPHWKRALLDLKKILENPKLYLNKLKIGLNVDRFLYEYSETLEDVLNDLVDTWKFTHYLKVKKLILYEYSWDQLSRILSSLKPGYLTTIDIFSTNSSLDSMNTMFEMEQWKQAKCCFMTGNRFVWPLRHLYHFVDFEVRLIKLSVEDVREMKEILFKSPNFESCLIWVLNDSGAKAIKEEFGDYIQQEQSISKYVKFYHYPIPNSKDYFEIKVAGFDFEITRMKR